MKDEPLISIVIPLYNKGAVIKRGLDSILHQLYTNWEAVIVDDGSTDDSAEYVKPYLSDERFKYFYKENGGVSSARNYGVENAKGEFVIFLDADDCFMPNAINTLFNLIRSFNVNVACANFFVEKKGVRKIYSSRFIDGIVENNFKAHFFRKMCPRTGAAIFRRDVLILYPFDTSLSRFEDAKELFDIMRNEKIANSSVPVMIYQNDNSELSTRIIDINKDFVDGLVFRHKSLWERIQLGQLLWNGWKSYKNKRVYLLYKYHINFMFCIIQRIIYISYK